MLSESKRDFKNSENIIVRLKSIVDLCKSFYGDNLLEIILFGSYAKNTYKKFSSIDLMVILKDSNQRITERIIDLFRILNDNNDIIQVDPIIYSKGEIEGLIIKKESFIISAISEGILIFPDENNYKSLEKVIKNNATHLKSRYFLNLPNLDVLD